MKITLNDFLLNDDTTQFYLDEDIVGLSLPEIRTSMGNYSGRDGGYVGAQFYGMRQISLQGQVFGEDIPTIEQKRRDIQEALRAHSVTMRIVTDGGQSYVIYCNLLRFDMPIKRTLNIAPFKIELLATDPLIYDDTNGVALTAALAKVVGGGYNTPVTYPVIWAPSAQPTTVINSGNAKVYPIVTMTDSATDPVIYNQTTGQLFGLTGFTMADGDVLVIDMRERTVTLNGGSVFNKISSGSEWWGLEIGGNALLLDSGSGSDHLDATISWRPAYMGI